MTDVASRSRASDGDGRRSDPRTAAPRPLRVATVITRLEGGAGRQVLRGAVALPSERFNVTLVTGSGQLLDEARATGLPVVVAPSLGAPVDPAHDLRALQDLTRVLVASSFDVVHTHCSKAGVLGRVAAHRGGVPAIVHTYHGFGFHAFQPAPVRAAYVAIERAVGRLTDLVLCVGPGVAAEASRRGLVAAERIRTVGVAVDERYVHPRDPATPPGASRARRRLGLPPTSSIVGAVGRLTYQKAPEDFVAMLEALRRPDVVGVWIGDGELAARVRDAARRRGVQLVLAGERDDVHELYRALDVLALTSRYEGLPTVLVEAMLSGVPVVATAVNGVPDVVRAGRTGLLVPPGRPREAAGAVRRILDDPALAAILARNARRDVAGRFTTGVLCRQLEDAYAAATDGASRGAARRPVVV